MQEQRVTGASTELPLPVITSGHFDPNCAWCLKKRGIPAGEGSHGICPACEAEELLKYYTNRAAGQNGATA